MSLWTSSWRRIMFDILIQALGIVAFLIITASYWAKKKIAFVILQIIAITMYATHFLLLGGLSGAWCNIVGLITLIVLFIREKKKVSQKYLFR